jgi:DNA-binding MarR family transcriptional regulator
MRSLAERRRERDRLMTGAEMATARRRITDLGIYGPAYDIAVLLAENPGRSFHVRDVASELELSIGTVLRTMSDMWMFHLLKREGGSDRNPAYSFNFNEYPPGT